MDYYFLFTCMHLTYILSKTVPVHILNHKNKVKINLSAYLLTTCQYCCEKVCRCNITQFTTSTQLLLESTGQVGGIDLFLGLLGHYEQWWINSVHTGFLLKVFPQKLHLFWRSCINCRQIKSSNTCILHSDIMTRWYGVFTRIVADLMLTPCNNIIFRYCAWILWAKCQPKYNWRFKNCSFVKISVRLEGEGSYENAWSQNHLCMGLAQSVREILSDQIIFKNL